MLSYWMELENVFDRDHVLVTTSVHHRAHQDSLVISLTSLCIVILRLGFPPPIALLLVVSVRLVSSKFGRNSASAAGHPWNPWMQHNTHYLWPSFHPERQTSCSTTLPFLGTKRNERNWIVYIPTSDEVVELTLTISQWWAFETNLGARLTFKMVHKVKFVVIIFGAYRNGKLT